MLMSNSTLDQLSSQIKTCKPTSVFTGIPVIDLLMPDAKTIMVKACKEFGFFKVINHGVPMEFITRLESEAINFFSLPQIEKEKDGPPNPYGYGNQRIGPNGDVGWVEYILLECKPESVFQGSQHSFGENPENFHSAVIDYVSAMRKLGCEVLELMAEGLEIKSKNELSKLFADKESNSIFRLNHYPPYPQLEALNGLKLVGFDEHTDPNIITILRSNNAMGLQIFLKDGSWVSIPPDPNSFFFNVGDALQVLTNGRFRSVKHRVFINGVKPRFSMIYFGGPPFKAKITPLKSIMEEGEESLYKEFTWEEYKKSAYKSRLSDNRLGKWVVEHLDQGKPKMEKK